MVVAVERPPTSSPERKRVAQPARPVHPRASGTSSFHAKAAGSMKQTKADEVPPIRVKTTWIPGTYNAIASEAVATTRVMPMWRALPYFLPHGAKRSTSSEKRQGNMLTGYATNTVIAIATKAGSISRMSGAAERIG